MRFAGMALDGGNYANAAMNSGSAMDSILAKNTPDFGTLSNRASASKSQEKVAGMEAEAMLQNAGINGLAAMEQSKFGAQAIEAQAAAQADATKSQGMSSMLGDIGGGLLKGFGKTGGSSLLGNSIDKYGANSYAGAFNPGGSFNTFGQF
jgi:hypothetical protein